MNDMRKLLETLNRIDEATSKVAHYFEHYPHYMGTKNSKFSVKIQQIDELHDAYLEDKSSVWDRMDEFGHNYAFGEVIQNWPAIRKQLERKGVWADQWEEGSHAVSMDGMRDAAQAVGEIEAKLRSDEFDEYGDDGDYDGN